MKNCECWPKPSCAASPRDTLCRRRRWHEAYLKLARQVRPQFQGRTHFRAAMAFAMRQILVDHARRKKTAKRWGKCQRVALGEGLAVLTPEPENILALDQALHRLAAKDPRKASIVELRLFGGLTVQEVAGLLGTSVSTIEQEWTFIRAWLRRELKAGRS
jgi:RNA polymerase sigma-70 factor (ECF subfamily)